jgi:uncharacterized protein (DUF2461 family)
LRRLFTEDEGRSELSARLSRSPKGFPAEHPAAELYRQKRWGFGASLEPEMATKPEFAKTVAKYFRAAAPPVAKYFRAAAPLVALLNRPLMVKAERPRKPLF